MKRFLSTFALLFLVGFVFADSVTIVAFQELGFTRIEFESKSSGTYVVASPTGNTDEQLNSGWMVELPFSGKVAATRYFNAFNSEHSYNGSGTLVSDHVYSMEMDDKTGNSYVFVDLGVKPKNAASVASVVISWSATAKNIFKNGNIKVVRDYRYTTESWDKGVVQKTSLKKIPTADFYVALGKDGIIDTVKPGKMAFMWNASRVNKTIDAKSRFDKFGEPILQNLEAGHMYWASFFVPPYSDDPVIREFPVLKAKAK